MSARRARRPRSEASWPTPSSPAGCCGSSTAAPAGFAPLLWFLPLVNTGVNILVLAPFILVTGSTRALFADEGLQVALRLVVRLLIGFGYVGLIVFTRDQLRAGGGLRIDD